MGRAETQLAGTGYAMTESSEHDTSLNTLAHLWLQAHEAQQSWPNDELLKKYWEGFLDATCVAMTIVSGLPPDGIQMPQAADMGRTLIHMRLRWTDDE